MEELFLHLNLIMEGNFGVMSYSEDFESKPWN